MPRLRSVILGTEPAVKKVVLSPAMVKIMTKPKKRVAAKVKK